MPKKIQSINFYTSNYKNRIKNEVIFKKKKNLFVIFNFISNLLLSKINILKKRNSIQEKNLYLTSKKKLWKSLIFYQLSKKNNHYKLLELLIIGKRLNMRKIISKFLTIFIEKNFDLNFWWKIAIFLENEKIKANFSLDFIVLHGIRTTGNFIFFIKEYLNSKLTLYKNSVLQSESCKFYKFKYLEKILTVMYCNFSKLNFYGFFKISLEVLGKIFWNFPHFLIPFEEIINIVKFRIFIPNNFVNLITIIFLPDYPILNSFYFFSIFMELKFNFFFLRSKSVQFQFTRTKFSQKKNKIYYSTSNLKKNVLLCSRDFFLYN